MGREHQLEANQVHSNSECDALYLGAPPPKGWDGGLILKAIGQQMVEIALVKQNENKNVLYLSIYQCPSFSTEPLKVTN